MTESCRQLDENRIGGDVPELVVDLFEAIDIQKQHRKRFACLGGPVDRVVQILLQQLPVGDTGQLIVQREVCELPLQADADERLRGLPPECLLQVEEVVVECGPAPEEADEDAEALPVRKQWCDAEGRKSGGTHGFREFGVLAPRLHRVDDRDTRGVSRGTTGATSPARGFVPAMCFSAPSSSSSMTAAAFAVNALRATSTKD